MRTRRRSARLALLVLVLTASPLLYEGGAVVAVRWHAMVGTYYEPRTPVYDHLAAAWQEVSEGLQRQMPGGLGSGHWRPALAVPAVVALAMFGSFLLRRGH